MIKLYSLYKSFIYQNNSKGGWYQAVEITAYLLTDIMRAMFKEKGLSRKNVYYKFNGNVVD